jgi:hypothetical protein
MRRKKRRVVARLGQAPGEGIRRFLQDIVID